MTYTATRTDRLSRDGKTTTRTYAVKDEGGDTVATRKSTSKDYTHLVVATRDSGRITAGAILSAHSRRDLAAKSVSEHHLYSPSLAATIVEVVAA